MTRKRLARLALVVAVAVVAIHLLDAVPREVDIEYALGPQHGAVTEARIAYLRHGERMKGVRFRYRDGAPPTVRHRVDLAPGRYEIVAELSGPGVRREVSRALEVPVEGAVRIDLFDRAYAERTAAGVSSTLPPMRPVPVQ